MKGKIDTKSVQRALDQVQGVFGPGPLAGKVVQVIFDKDDKGHYLQLRGAGNGMDVKSDAVRITADGEGVYHFVWDDFQSVMTWPRLKVSIELNFSLDPKEGVEGLFSFVVTRGRARLEATTSTELVAAPEVVEPVTKLLAESAIFANSLKDALSTSGKNDVRAFLNGVLLDLKVESGEVRFVGTDGHRLTLVDIESGQIDGQDMSVIIPTAGCQQIESFMTRYASEYVGVGVCDTHIIIKGTGGYRLRSQLIDGRFPDYQRLIPEVQQDRMVKLSKDELSFGLGIAGKGAKHSQAPLIGCTFSESAVSLKAVKRNTENSSIELSEYVAEASGHTGEDVEVALSLTYLTDAISLTKGQEVLVSVTAQDKPVLLVEGKLLTLIMPTRV
ncbi:hypothetical protein ACP3V3_02160 [Vibrio sp. PNB22_3_1]